MKKIVMIMLLIVSTLVLTITPAYAKETDINDERIDVEIIRDNTVVEIKHMKDWRISHAVVEYAFLEDGINVAQLGTISVKDNKFTVDSKWTAIKVHQVKRLVGQVYYTHMAQGKNTIGSFANVKRQNIVEIQTVAVKTIKTKILTGMSPTSPLHKYYEFYFKFDKKHDKLAAIDASYVIEKKWWFIGTGKENIEKEISIYDGVFMSGYVSNSIGTTFLPTPATESVKGLEKNTDKNIDANYVARVSGDIGTWGNNYTISNFVILRVKYYLDGEFIIDDVINNPTSPQDDLNYLQSLVEQIKKLIEYIQGLNWSNILLWIVAILCIPVVIGLILIIWFFIKIVISSIKLVFKTIKSILKFIKWVLIPNKKRR
ncbi:hypothetical protein BN85407510 [Alteracholeplasma palmae J233]|uniref:Uncharacterized protein n=1 Tax=Alteracholeplasma palmae (strain ATCC 49389 / J233) TaxID=1318466 RepID=U4KKW3_ALTPJ|nr:hypothetical protein [Alteracholeplasma palmae]CCV64328.1 hypothetical protein BN85407510 [Alteracholeplasma palmae J233]